MAITNADKKALVAKYGKNENDTGLVESQVAIFTAEIANLTEHVKANKKDMSGKRGLYQMVSKRRSLLNYLKKTDINRYRELIKNLGLRN
ncbi:MAG: 30S ribosomal protein S15 [Mycoplasmataceae bacterium]|jgi:small subunit ribosomal protein S15|nr:30S ribosomal protein S15 [Mycoplasmataceae bacterium]